MPTHQYNKNNLIHWYDEHSKNYDKETFLQDEQSYGGDLYRILLVANLLESLKPKKVLDVGCGTAEPMLRFLKSGYDMHGFDLSPGMVEQGKRKMIDNGYSGDLVNVGDILDPEIVGRYGKGAFDAVVANGVLPYIEDCDTAHRNLTDLIKPGGYYISAYSNALMDMMTFNRFTMRFYLENYISPLAIDDKDKKEIMDNLQKLITYPDKPKSIPEGARDEIYVGAHNPMTIGETLKTFGLLQQDILFYKFHAFPPLLKNVSPLLQRVFMEQSREYEVKKARDWRGYFLASTFIVVAKKIEGS